MLAHLHGTGDQLERRIELASAQIYMLAEASQLALAAACGYLQM